MSRDSSVVAAMAVVSVVVSLLHTDGNNSHSGVPRASDVVATFHAYMSVDKKSNSRR